MAAEKTISLKLRVWRQDGPHDRGRFETYDAPNLPESMSFLEVLDVVNDGLVSKGEMPIAFDHDCREGICGTCGIVIDGQAHGPIAGTTVCQLHLHAAGFGDGATLTLEPWRARAFPIMRDLMVDRTAFERIQAAGGYASVNCGNAPDANAMLVGYDDAEEAMDAAACIGCGACVAACKNASAMLFTSARVGHYAMLPQGQPERARRAVRMFEQMEAEGFGACSNTYDCEAACPKSISTKWITKGYREYVKAKAILGQD
jgi:succinate dehydrogenase / fumarate reductase iron-sulfur subunit